MKLYRFPYHLTAIVLGIVARLTYFFTPAIRFLNERLIIAADALAPIDTHAVTAMGIAAPTSEVRYLTQGIHRRAQPRSHQTDPGDPTDDDDGNDMRDNGLRESMRC